MPIIQTRDPLKNFYTSFEEKKESIHSLNNRIKSTEDVEKLFNWLGKAKEHGYIIFRGMSESNYKHYSHSQRQFSSLLHNRESYELFYELIIDTVEYAKKWNNGTIKKYLLKLGIEDNFFAYLSLMQHYGIPTPLIDFTRNPYVALYFSTSKHSPLLNENDINEYCSLYFINGDYHFLNGFRRHFENTIQKNLRDGYSKERAFFYGLRFTPYLIIRENDLLFQISNNINIVNQEGLFILNGDPNQPLEDQHSLDRRREKNSSSRSSKLFGCWEIHKSMNGYIREKLNSEMGINESFLFPDMHKLKSDFKTEFRYPTDLEVSPDGSYWRSRERAIKYTRLSKGLQQIEGQPITFTKISRNEKP